MAIFFLLIAFIFGLLLIETMPIFVGILSFLYITYLVFRKGYKFAILGIIVLVIGVIISQIQLTHNPSDYIYQGIVIESKQNYLIYLSGGEKFYVAIENNPYEIGDFLKIIGKPQLINFTNYESRFDFGEYLRLKGIGRELLTPKINTIFATPFRINSIKERFLANFAEDVQAILSALLFHERDYSSPFIQNIASLNIVYLFAISGLYLNFLLRGTKYLLSLKLSDTLATFLSYLLFFPYLLFVFYRVSILRIFLYGILKELNKVVLKNKFSNLTILSTLATSFLLVDYHLIYQSSFYIGFGIAFLFQFVGITFFKEKNNFQKIAVPVLIYLCLIPFSSSFDNAIHPFAIIYQFVLFPINLPFICLSLISFFIYPLPFLINPYGLFIQKTIDLFMKADLKIYLGEWIPLFLLFYYLVIFYALYLLESRRKHHFYRTSLFLVIILLFQFLPIKNYVSSGVYFINVGQGDAILLKDKSTAILVDTGGSTYFDMAVEVLIPFFRKKGVDDIDCLIITHDDFDHSGAKNSLIENFTVKECYSNSDAFPLKIGNIEMVNLNNYDFSDSNDCSLVLYFIFLGRKFLLMGDASKKVEKEILNDNVQLTCDILKVGHHGSNTSSNYDFIKSVMPKEAVISVGRNNYYGHPSEEVLETLSKLGVKIRRTDIEGTIVYT